MTKDRHVVGWGGVTYIWSLVALNVIVVGHIEYSVSLSGRGVVLVDLVDSIRLRQRCWSWWRRDQVAKGRSVVDGCGAMGVWTRSPVALSMIVVCRAVCCAALSAICVVLLNLRA